MVQIKVLVVVPLYPQVHTYTIALKVEREDINTCIECRNPNGECRVWHVTKARQRGPAKKYTPEGDI